MPIDFLKRKENIIITAIDLLDEAGIQGLTTKEIARRQGITEPAIYRQFSGKQEIVLTIFDRYSVFDDVIINTIKEQAMGSREGLIYYLRAYSEYYENYPQITTVMFSYDVYKYDKTTNEKMKKIIEKRQEFVTGLIEKGQKTGEIRNDINAHDLADIILGLVWSLTYKWKTFGCNFSLKEKILDSIGFILG